MILKIICGTDFFSQIDCSPFLNHNITYEWDLLFYM